MILRRYALIALSTSLLFACGEADDNTNSAEDSELGSFFAQGKADDQGTSCETEGILSWVNRGDNTVDAFKASGVHTRAAKNIVAYRLGDDGTLNTQDDRTIESLKELDDIRYVGKAAFQQIIAAVDAAGLCQTTSAPKVDVIFSPQPIEKSHLVRAVDHVKKAKRSIDIAMYSFNYGPMNDELKRAINRGVKVRVIFESANKDRKDPAGSKSAKLEDLGADVRYINKIMHHKYAIIDGPRDELESAKTGTLMSGSGNWSTSAGTRYDENTVFITGAEELNLRYQAEFNHLWHNSRDFVWGEEKTFDPGGIEITADQLDVDKDAHAVFTSANYKTFVSSRYGNTFSRVRGLDEISDEIVRHIQDAKFSIKIASGHLRSRPIAEALIEKHKTNPEVDIKVYLDGQEFISEWYAGEQERKLQDCLSTAGTSEAKIEDCQDKGFYFGYALHEAGIDVRYKYYSYRWHYRTAAQMHHKYLIFDGQTVIQGSYNLSSNAEHNTMENMAILGGATYVNLVAAYDENFDSIWDTGRQPDLYTELTNDIQNATSSIPIVFDSMSLDWTQVDELKKLIRDTCPAINSEEYRENPDKKFNCEL